MTGTDMAASLPADRLDRVVVTGGAGGFGRALGERFLRRGSRVLLTDVDADRARRTAGELSAHGEVHALAHDVRDPDAWDAVVAWTDARWGGADVVVNNAGVAVSGTIDEIPVEDWDWIIAINLKGVALGCRAFTPQFKARGRGHLVNVASLAAFGAAPLMSPYNATKAAVLALSETLDAELSRHGIATTVVCPSFFPTDIGRHSRGGDDVKELTEKLLTSGRLTAADVADRTVRAVEKRQFLVLPHVESRAITTTKRLAPWAYRRLARLVGDQVERRTGVRS